MRISDKYLQNKMLMFFTNYVVCILLSSVYFKGNVSGFFTSPGLTFAIILGIISGILYLVSFFVYQYNIRQNGVVLASTFMKLGVVIPTLMAILVFGEAPTILQIVGILLACFAIVLSQLKPNDSVKVYSIWLLVLMFISGFTDSLANIYDKIGDGGIKDCYLFVTFLIAALCALIAWLYKGGGISKYDILFGCLIGIPNYYSARFLILALGKLPAIVVYPGYSTLTIVTTSLAGFLFFKEKCDMQKLAVIFIILVSIVFLSLG